MGLKRVFLGFIGLFCLSIPVSHAQDILSFAMIDSNIKLCQSLGIPQKIDVNQKLTPSPWSKAPLDRSIIDYLVLAEALREGGYKGRLELSPIPNPARGLNLVKTGEADIITLWQRSATSELLISKPYIEKNTLEKGLYTSSQNSGALAVRTIAELRRLSAGTEASWANDREILESLGLMRTEYPSKKSLVYKMLLSGRIDFTLASFSNLPNRAVIIDGQTYVPIPGFKVSFKDSLHYFAATKNPKATDIISWINLGLEKLHTQGFITKVLVNNGISNPSVKNWTNLSK